ncbi:MAG: LemA family protein [Fimbriimonadaceae bacterium]|nr:LemA family protein [Fimbriimonadaceae bacterium]
MPWVLVALVVLPLVFWIGTQNRLVRLKNMIRESWANVDVQLKRRYDLILELVRTVRAYADHERDLFERIARAREAALRSAGSAGEQARDENELVHGINTLLGRIEGYPELRASRHFLELQRELADTEDRIAAARRFFNANVREFNTALDSFPSSIVANAMALRRETFFEIDDLRVRSLPDADRIDREGLSRASAPARSDHDQAIERDLA